MITFFFGDSNSPCKGILFPRGPNPEQKPLSLVDTVLKNGMFLHYHFIRMPDQYQETQDMFGKTANITFKALRGVNLSLMIFWFGNCLGKKNVPAKD